MPGQVEEQTASENRTHHVVKGRFWRDESITELRISYRNYSSKGRDDLSCRAARYAW